MKLFLLFLLWGHWYLVFSARSIISPIMPLIEVEFSISHAMAGGLFSSFWAGNTIAIFYSGFLSLKIGYKKTIIIAFIIMCLTFFMLRFSGTYHFFAVNLFILGLGTGLYLPCAIPLITTVFEQRDWGKAISFHETAAGLSLLTSPFIIVFALSFNNWKSIFLIVSAACLVITVIFLRLSPDPRPEKKEKANIFEILKRKDFWIITVVWVCCSIGSLGIYSIIPLYLVNERAIQIDSANTIFGISRIGGFIAMISMGFIMDRFKLRRVLMVIILATGFTTIGIALVHSYLLISVTLFFQATFSVVFFPAGLVAISKLTTLSERSVFTGVLMSLSSIFGMGLFPLILGTIADIWNFQIGILISGIIITTAYLPLRSLKEI